MKLVAPPRRRAVHIWWLDLAPNAPRPDAGSLTVEELERATRFATGALRERFVRRRVALRRVLSSYIGIDPEKVQLRHTPCTACGEAHGKPAVASDLDLRFSAASTGSLGVVAVASGCEVGVDVERSVSLAVAEQLARVCLTEDELSALPSAGADARARAVIVAWCRKEAYLKARGVGLNVPPDLVALEHSRGRLRVVRAPDDPEAAVRWTLHDLQPGTGYAATLVAEGPIEIVVDAGRVR